MIYTYTHIHAPFFGAFDLDLHGLAFVRFLFCRANLVPVVPMMVVHRLDWSRFWEKNNASGKDEEIGVTPG